MMDQDTINELTKHYLSNTSANIVGVGYAKKTVGGKLTDEDAIVFTVKNKKPLEEIPENEILPSKIQVGDRLLPTDVEQGVYRMVQSCPSDFYTWQNPSTPPGNRNQFRPLQGGVSVTNYTNLSNYVGTLGFLAVDTQTDSLVGVSNNHVLVKNAFLASERQVIGVHTSIYNNFVTQPNDGSNRGLQNSIGLVKRYVPISGSPEFNTVDAALTTINESDINYSESYKQFGMTGWPHPLEFASTSEINSLLANGNNLFSSGRTTGPKGEGSMKLLPDASTFTVSIEYNNQGTEEEIYFSDCLRFKASASTTPSGSVCSYPINGGDSGSALVADFSGTRKIVGLVFASMSVSAETQNGIEWVVVRGLANRIDKVAEQLSISAWTGNSVYFSDTGSTQLHTVQGLSSDINIELLGNTYWQAGTTN